MTLARPPHKQPEERFWTRLVLKSIASDCWVLENLFTFDGEPGHEIVFVYEAEFVNESRYLQSEIQGFESNGAELKLKWVSQKRG